MSLLALTAHVEVPVGRGENRGREIAYTNVVRSERAIAPRGDGRWHLPAALLQQPGADRFAILLRAREDGPIIAGRYL